jgi:hypothetical protein
MQHILDTQCIATVINPSQGLSNLSTTCSNPAQPAPASDGASSCTNYSTLTSGSTQRSCIIAATGANGTQNCVTYGTCMQKVLDGQCTKSIVPPVRNPIRFNH